MAEVVSTTGAALRSPASQPLPAAVKNADAEKLQFIEEMTSNVDAVQERVLGEILARNAGTEYLAKYGLAAATTDRATFRAKIAAMRHLFAACDPIEIDFGEAHRCFDVLRAEAFVAGMRDAYEKDPASLGPNTRANFEMGAAMSLKDCAWAQAEQTRLIKRFQRAFDGYDLILSPTTPVSPFPWTQLYAEAINGKRQENYYRWLALTYVITLTTHPALTLPCGRDHKGMPFGLQIVGRFRGDRELLAAAQGMESAFAGNAELSRPRPDLAALKPAEPALTSIVTAPPGRAQGDSAATVSAV